MNKLLVLVILLLSVGSSAVLADTQQYMLKNGLQILVKEDHRFPIVVSMLCYKVGSSDETNGLTGISHALEHMMFKGTLQHPAGEFSKLISVNGGDNNAFTSRDYTCYHQTFTNSKLKVSFALEADRMQHLNPTAEEFAKEIQVVMEERRMRTDDNPISATYERFMAGAHITNPYHHQPIGWINDLEHMTVKDVIAWYKRWYIPNNAILIVVGDVKSPAVLQLATHYFGHIPKATLSPAKPRASQTLLGKREINVNLPAKLPWLIMGYNTPSVLTSQDKWKAYALEVLSAILAGGDSARLPSHLIRQQQLASEIDINFNLYAKYDDVLTINGIPAEGHTTESLASEISAEIQHLKMKPVTTAELSKAKTYLIAQTTYAKDSLFYQAMLLGSMTAVGLPQDELDHYADHIQAVTAEQIKEVANEFLTDSRLTVGTLVPVKKGVVNAKKNN